MTKQQFEIPAVYKKWTYGFLAVGLVAFIAGVIFLALSKEEHDHTRFWAVLLQNSLFFPVDLQCLYVFYLCQYAWAQCMANFISPRS